MKLTDFFFKKSPVLEEKSEPILQETAWCGDTFFGKNQKFEAYDPDRLRANKGCDIYEKMLRDPQVKSAFNLVLDLIVSKEYRFEKIDDSEEQNKIVDFFQYNIDSSLRGNFKQALRSILMAKAYGFSICEKNFCVDEYHGESAWLLESIKYKKPHTFKFIQDVYGNIISIEQQVGSSGKLKLEPSKFIIFTIYPEFDPIYGESDLRAAYRPFWEKDNIIKFRNIYLEKFAGGVIIATPGENAVSLSATETQDFLYTLKRVSTGTAMTMPQGWETMVQQATSTTAYDDAIEHCDKQIAKSVLVPNLLGFSEQGNTGSFAQSKTQLDTFWQLISTQSDQLAEVLNEQLFRELAWWNFGVKEFPRFKFEPYNTEQKREIAVSWMTAVEKGVVINTYNDELRTRELLLYDEREEDEEPLVNPNTENEQTDDIGKNPEDKEKQKSEPKKETKKDIKASDENQIPNNLWRDRINFNELSDAFDSVESSFVFGLSENIDTMIGEVKQSIENIYSEMIGDGAKSEIDMELVTTRLESSISKQSKSDLNQVVRENLRKSYEKGRKIAIDVIEKATENTDSEMSQKIVLAAKTSKRFAVKHSSDYKWSVYDFVEGLRLDTAEKYFSAKAFEITGNLSQDLIEKAKTVILSGIRDELSINDIVIQLDELLMQAGLLENPDKDKLTKSKLETIARTNITESFNQASLAVYNDPDIGDFVEAMEYSAILDSRTTDFCRRYDNRVYLRTDSIWKGITPPNHFNALVEGTPILTEHGYLPIEKVVPGTKVLTHRKRWKPVYALMGKRSDHPTVKQLNLSTGRVLRITDEHPVLTSSGWKLCGDLQAGDVLFEYGEQMSRVGDVVLPDPENCEPFTDEPLVSYEVALFSSQGLMAFPVDFNNDISFWKKEVNNVSTNYRLRDELNIGLRKHLKQHELLFGWFLSHSICPSFITFLQNVWGLDRIIVEHSLRMLSSPFTRIFPKSIGPVRFTSGTVGVELTISDTGLFSSSTNFNTMPSTPETNLPITASELSFNRSKGALLSPVLSIYDFFNQRFVSQIHSKPSKNKVWNPSRIVSITNEKDNSNLWNLAVEEDETYLANNIIVHNCRSTMIPVTALDTYEVDDRQRDLGGILVQPAPGFGNIN